MDPNDGAIRALVGGIDFDLSKFNHITQGYRQPGSTIKPFIYSAAMQKNGMNPNSIVNDAEIQVGSWKPKNADGRYLGPIPLSTALASSRNMVSIRLLQSIGNDYFRSYAERFGRRSVIAMGAATLILAGLTAPLSPQVLPIAVALFLLGLGWNFCYVGGSSLLADQLSPAERARTQGFNDLLIGLSSAAASLLSGIVFATVGYGAMGLLGATLAVIPLVMAMTVRPRAMAAAN